MLELGDQEKVHGPPVTQAEEGTVRGYSRNEGETGGKGGRNEFLM